MKVIIGYSMRSGSTVLSHVLGGHSAIRSYSDLSCIGAVARMLGRSRRTLVVKPPDLFFLQDFFTFTGYFDKAIWLTRDPRDSYLSSVESGYAYLLRGKGAMEAGVDTGLIRRWARINRHYFSNPDRWYLVRYEEFTNDPVGMLQQLLSFLELPEEKLLPYVWRRRDWLRGGDYKLARERNINRRVVGRYRKELSLEQCEVFNRLIGEEMTALGYPV